MFTDELMEQKYTQTRKVSDALIVLFESVFDASNKDKENSHKLIPIVYFQIANNIWKLFASRHSEINPNEFKNILLKYVPDKADYINSILDGHIYGKI